MSKKIAAARDLLLTTQPNLPDNEFNVEWTHQRYEAARIFNEETTKFDGGDSIQRHVVFDEGGHASYRDLYEQDSPSVEDHQKKVNIPWRIWSTNYSWDVFEIEINAGNPEGFIDLFKTKRLDALWSLANLFETNMWQAPISATSTRSIYGIPYYLNVLNNAVTTAGFSGQTIRFRDGTTSTTCAGLDASTTANAPWRNWADVYTSINADFLKKVRKAIRNTQFKPPMYVEDPLKPGTGKKRVYTDGDTRDTMEELLDQRDDFHKANDLMGNVMANKDGAVLMRNMPVVWIPKLDDASFSPVYCVDYEFMQPFVHSGYWMEETEPMSDRGQHTTFTIYIDGAHNILCTSRRKVGFVLHTVSS